MSEQPKYQIVIMNSSTIVPGTISSIYLKRGYFHIEYIRSLPSWEISTNIVKSGGIKESSTMLSRGNILSIQLVDFSTKVKKIIVFKYNGDTSTVTNGELLILVKQIYDYDTYNIENCYVKFDSFTII